MIRFMGRTTAPDGPTRQRLVEAAREIVRDDGLAAATARAITGRAEANLSAIPYYFGTKDALVAEALVSEGRDLLAPVWEALGGDGEPVARAHAAAAVLHQVFAASRDRVPAYVAAVGAAAHDDAVRDGLGELWGELRGRLAADVATQVEAGGLPPWVDPDAAAALVLAVVNGVVVASVLDPDGPDHLQVGSLFLTLLAGAAS